MTTLPMTDEELAQHEQNYAGVEGSIEDRLFKYIHDLKGRLDKSEREAKAGKVLRGSAECDNEYDERVIRGDAIAAYDAAVKKEPGRG